MIEVVGKNVSLLMSEPDSSRHNGYLSTYLKTGNKRVIGTYIPVCHAQYGILDYSLGVGRDVVALHKDGRSLPVHLSVTERKDGEKRIFTGIIQKLVK